MSSLVATNNSIMILSTLVLWLVSSVGSACAQEQSGQRLFNYNLYLSHLSPMITYQPVSSDPDIPTGWNVTLDRSRATRTGASVEFDYFGTTFEVWGNGTDYDYDISNLGDHDTRYFTRSEIGEPAMFGILTGIDYDRHQVQMRNNESEDSLLEVRGFMLRTAFPQVDGFSEVIHRSGAELHEIYSDSDPANAWETLEPPSNQSTNTPVPNNPSQPEGPEVPFNTTVLSTDQVGQRLYFELPRQTSFVQIYGTVGPDQGEYEVRLIPTRRSINYQDVKFAPQPGNQTFTGAQPVDANFQVKYYAFLDPRESFAMEIELLEEGKRADLHGASFYRFSDEDAEIKDWYTRDSGGLSGGQIAGIVVGTVAGAALIGLAIWFFVRRRRSKSSQSTFNKVDSSS